ncbi:MAG: DegT/DnrJ/EryC1/StrS family aminotransferase [Fuerstiella sp.]
MPSFPATNNDVYCYLKQSLEPAFDVVSDPQVGYFAQWLFSYRILKDQQLQAELQGDFRKIPAGSLINKAQGIIRNLRSETSEAQHKHSSQKPAPNRTAALPIASRLPPLTDSRTWFSSGRAAFAWLLKDAIRPRRVILPTFICWSLVDVVVQRFPNIQLDFYSVSRTLNKTYPVSSNADDAIVDVHYFGHKSSAPVESISATVLEDWSHCPLTESPLSPTDQRLRPGSDGRNFYRFGSLRKAYRVADGGFIDGLFNPKYESDAHPDAWLRLAANHWTDLREAENMLDREFRISDISSQSLAVILKTQPQLAADRRRANNSYLNENLATGNALVKFANNEAPLLHGRRFDSEDERNSFRHFLADRQIFTSIHWPVHEHLKQRQDTIDIEDALWLEQHTLAFPISDHLTEQQMEQICDAAAEWKRAGASRFAIRSTG